MDILLEGIDEDDFDEMLKAVTPWGEDVDLEDFEQWFLSELQKESQKYFLGAKELMWRIVEKYLADHGGLFSRLSPGQVIELIRTLFEAGLAHTSHMVGIELSPDLKARLTRMGWTGREIGDFPGLAYRFGLMKVLLEQGRVKNFRQLIELAQAHPLTRAEQEAIAISRNNALLALRPVFDTTGRLILGEALEREKGRLRGMVTEAIAKREHPLVLAREMGKIERAKNIQRDWERIAITEIADAHAKGAWQADRKRGLFKPPDLVYRITRPTACKICLALYTNPDGTPRLYKIKDLENETTPLIDIGVRKKRLYRAVIGATHPNEKCSDWQKYFQGMSEPTFKEFAPRYREGRRAMGLPVREAA